MKTTFKHVLAMMAFVTAGAANAQRFIDVPNPFNYPSTESLVFSSDALSALSASGTAIRTPSVAPSIPGFPGIGAVNAASYDKPNATLVLSGSVLAFADNNVTSVSSPSSLVQLLRGEYNDDGIVSYSSVYLTGWEFNLTQGTIYASIYATEPDGQSNNFGKTAIFQADKTGVVGGTQGRFDGSGTASGTLAGNLRLTTQAANIFLASLGLADTGPVADLFRKSNWGTASFTTAVPEPSSFALFGIGLLGLGALARRRQA